MILNDDFCSDKWMLYIQISIFSAEDLGYVMEYYDESPGISFDKEGTSILIQCGVEGCSVCKFERNDEPNKYVTRVYCPH